MATSQDLNQLKDRLAKYNTKGSFFAGFCVTFGLFTAIKRAVGLPIYMCK